MYPSASRPLPAALAILFVLFLAGLPATVTTAQEGPATGDDPSRIAEATLDLTTGERGWVAVVRSSLADEDPPIPARDGLLYAPDAPLLLLYEGGSRIDRVQTGKALSLHDGDTVRPVAMQDGPASVLAVALADPRTPADGDVYAAVGEPFAVPAGPYTLALRRFDLTTRAGRQLQDIQRTLAALKQPALLYVEAGEITATAVGEDTPATLKQHEAMAVDGTAGLTTSDDGAPVIVLVTLEPVVAATSAGGTTTQINSDTALPGGAPTPTPSTTATTTATAGPTTVPTAVPTAAPTAAPADADGDGLSDADEAARGTNPNSNDTDGDGVFDGYEVSVGLNPTKTDTDGDGVSDYDEVAADTVDPGSGDADGDGLTDGYEGQVTLTNPNDADSDDDGLNDGDENSRGTNPLDADSDDDGLTDGDEVGRGTNPLNRDSDGEGLSDGFEVNQGTSPLNSDTDGDGVDDGYETGRGMNPRSTDSDGDGLSDGAELNTYGSNPTNSDSDGDGKGDGDEVACGQDPNTFTDYTDVVSCP